MLLPCSQCRYYIVHGSWSSWSAWSECDGCDGFSNRTRDCNNPPARFGGLPCLGESMQSRGCHDNMTVCSGRVFIPSKHLNCFLKTDYLKKNWSSRSSLQLFPEINVINSTMKFMRYFLFAECGGGQEEWPCGKPCPRSCSDLHGDTECLDSPGCSKTCGCPGDMVLQDGACVTREECRCKYENISAAGERSFFLKFCFKCYFCNVPHFFFFFSSLRWFRFQTRRD